MELRRAGLTANPRKCYLGLSEAKYLGFQVGLGLTKPQEKKVVVVVVVVVVVALYCHLVTSTSEISHQPAHT